MKTMNIVKTLSPLLLLSVTFQAEARKRDYPKIYPFVPIASEQIKKDVEKISEDENYIINFFDGVKHKEGKSKNKPWTSSFWPLNRGLIADPYPDNKVMNYLNLSRAFSWEYNRDKYEKRKSKIHNKIDKLTNEQLDKLAPSEKYDLLLGDKEFHLTNKLWTYAIKWGQKKKYGNLTNLNITGGGALDYAQQIFDWGWYNNIDDSRDFAMKARGGLTEAIAQELIKKGQANSLESAIQMAAPIAEREKDNYVLEEVDDSIATWEGICHGWSTAAGIIPRPKKTVTINLKDGRKLRFFPEDIKGLVSLLWANSLIQDGKWLDVNTGENIGGGVIMQGLRCNERNPRKDEWGRYYDTIPNADTKVLQPRCVGVHPAIWHLGLVNLLGKQQRSFVVERKIKAAVDNHPMDSYKMEFFNPNTGQYFPKKEDLLKNLTRADKKNDQFAKFRAKGTEFIVGVKTTMIYLDWANSTREKSNSPKDDSFTKISMLYDLELDIDGNIIGGQWRSTEVGKPADRNDSSVFARAQAAQDRKVMHRQPDFFWVITKDWKPFFKPNTEISKWEDTSTVPPSDWLKPAKIAHDFIYYKTHGYGFNEKCKMVHKDKKKKKTIEVPCEFEVSKPQPLINVVDKLVELSK